MNQDSDNQHHHHLVLDPHTGWHCSTCGESMPLDYRGRQPRQEQPLLPPQLGITLYIAGPMTGLPENNYPAFHQAAGELRAAGYRVLNPAENPEPCRNPTWQDWMRAALAQLIQADAIATLDGWNESRGATVEVALAGAIDIPCDPVARHIHVAAKMAGTR